MVNNYSKNIPRLYLIKMAKWFSLVMPVIVLFYESNDLGMTEIFILKSIYSIAMLLFEIPSGYFGDVWGRKNTLITGSILTCIGFSIYSFSPIFLGFVIAEIFLGIGQSFISGADSAMLFDSLKGDQREGEYMKQEGRFTSVGNFSEAIAGVIGGLLAAISIKLPFVCQAMVAGLAIPAAITLKEPIYSLQRRKAGFRDIWNVVKSTMRNAQLRAVILISAIIGTATLTFAWFVQPMFIEVELPVAFFGIAWTILNVTVGTVSAFAYRIEKNVGQQRSIFSIIILVSLGFVLCAITKSYAVFVILFLFYIVRGFATPVLKEYIQRLINSDVRATVLSLRNMFIRINFAIIGPVLGWLTDHYSLRTALLAAGLSFFTLASIAFALGYKSLK